LGLGTAGVRCHYGLAHAEHFKTYVFAFAIAVEPEANDVCTAGCEVDVMSLGRGKQTRDGRLAGMGEVVDNTRFGVGLGRDDAGAVAAANVSNFIATISTG
jgi:hypothetical protein